MLNRAGTLVAATGFASGSITFLNSVVAVDIDADGDMDAVAARGETGQVILLRNGGDGRFNAETLLSFGGQRVRAVRAADTDGDAAPDVVVLTGNPAGGGALTRVFRMINGSPAPNPVVVPLSANGDINDIALFDADGDGDVDIAALSVGVQKAILALNSAGEFASAGAFPIESATGETTTSAGAGLNASFSLCAGDFDGDGDMDIAAPYPSAAGGEGALNILYNAPEPTTFRYRGDLFGGDAARAENWIAETPFFIARAASFLRAGST